MTMYNHDTLQDIHCYGATLNSREIFLHNFFLEQKKIILE